MTQDPTSIAQEPCMLLDWDSAFFGFPIAKVQGDILTKERMQAIDAWCYRNHISCLYFLGRPDNQQTTILAEDNQFRFVDIRVELKRVKSGFERFPELDRTILVRAARDDDLPALQTIARCNYQDSRFYYDRNFDSESCQSLYATWIEVSCKGYADAVFVANDPVHGPVGYITCHLDEGARRGKVGLMGVAHEARGQMIGTGLVFQALEWFGNYDLDHTVVVTQGRNHLAQRFYQRCGFFTQSVSLWYHKWYHSPPNSNG